MPVGSHADDSRSSLLGIDRAGWLLFIAQGLSGLGTGAFVAFGPIYQRSLGASAVEIGLIAAFGMTTATVCMIPGAWLAEQRDLRKTIIAGWLLAVPGPVLFALAPSWGLTALGTAFLMSSVFNTPAINVYLTVGLPRERVGVVMTTVFSAFSLGLIGSNLLAGWMAQLVAVRFLFLVSLIFYCAASACILFLPPRPRPVAGGSRITARQLLQFPSFLALLGLFVFVTLLIFLPWPFTPLYLEDVIRVPNLEIGTLMAVLYLGSALIGIGLSSLRRPLGGMGVVLCFEAAFVLSAVLLLTSGGVSILTLGCFLRGAFWSFRPVMTAAIGEVLPNAALARGYGMFALATGGAAAVAYPIGGWLYAGSPQAPFWCSAALMVLTGLATLSLRRMFKPAAIVPVPTSMTIGPTEPIARAA